MIEFGIMVLLICVGVASIIWALGRLADA